MNKVDDTMNDLQQNNTWINFLQNNIIKSVEFTIGNDTIYKSQYCNICNKHHEILLGDLQHNHDMYILWSELIKK
jgi:transcription elongation factor Elf1